ncbi:MAG: hypothetical protein PHX15_01735 [Candidatus Nanoarchaeia archaeon]|nr:hypothetical protein [Candidatus Nanoarchaeia archaeon]MDD3993895.1 hypothetical protein [Candidatus Nanoarchaeia archaeon]MDD4563588.1 hypothetical protein [Candidatus Nanoarchaeia archaeon]
MNTKLILTAFIFLIILSIITNNTKELTYSGLIKKITIKEEITFLELEETNIQFVIFTNNLLNLKIKDQIKIIGQKQIYNNQEQIKINEIYLLKKLS